MVSFVSRNWLTVAFVGGFITDLILLNRIDDVVDNAILAMYVILATLSILLFYAGVAEKLGMTLSRLVVRNAPIVMQYAFGGLLSGMLIFYGRSGDWLASAPFMLLILAVIVGNELFEKKSELLVWQLMLYFIGIFSYAVLILPVVLGKTGDGIFLLSGLVALLLFAGVVQLLYRIIPNFLERSIRRLIFAIGVLYFGMSSLYFFNLIPPIPLSLTELDIVESVYRDNSGNYRITDEKQAWYRRLPLVRDKMNPDGRTIACFARVYAPTRLEARIFHRWERYDESSGWQEVFRFGYPITGENSGGYRGYTVLDNFSDGLWRCGVENERGQVLGRTSIIIDSTKRGGEAVTRVE